MSNKLYVGNISFQLDEDGLKSAFSEVGNVLSVKIISDRDTGRSKGFGFVEMESAEIAEQCVSELNGKELAGRNIRVDVAKEREGGR